MRKLNFIILLLSLLFLIFEISNSESQNTNKGTHDLEVKKLELEISKLEREESNNTIRLWLTIIGSCFGAITLSWTVYYGLRAISQQTKQRKNARVSSLLEILSSDSMSKRLGGARGLSRYAEEAIPELLAASSTEWDVNVRQAIEDSLASLKGSSTKRIIEANSNTLARRMHLLGQIHQISSNIRSFESFGFSSQTVMARFRGFFRVEYQHGQLIQKLRAGRKDFNLKKDEEEIEVLQSNLTQLAKLTSFVIARWIRTNTQFAWPHTGLYLPEVVLYKGRFESVSTNCSIFSYSIMRHCIMDHCTFIDSDFSYADLYDSSIDACTFRNCFFISSNMRSISAKKASFLESDLSNTVLSQSDLTEANFADIKAKSIQLRGTKLVGANFSNAVLNEGELNGAVATNASFENAKLFGAKLVAANFEAAVARGAKFNGADLSNVNFQGADLREADFSGAILKKANFQGAKIDKAKFNKCKFVDSAFFDASGIGIPEA